MVCFGLVLLFFPDFFFLRSLKFPYLQSVRKLFKEAPEAKTGPRNVCFGSFLCQRLSLQLLPLDASRAGREGDGRTSPRGDLGCFHTASAAHAPAERGGGGRALAELARLAPKGNQ